MILSCSIFSLIWFPLIQATPVTIPISPAIQQPNPNNDVAPSMKESLNGLAVTCNGTAYGEKLASLSCAQLVRDQLQPLKGSGTFAPRGTPDGQRARYPTPWRWVSDDGLCALSIFQTSSRRTITENLSAIRVAAEVMLRQCAPLKQGSVAMGFDSTDSLALTMSSYAPRVTCLAPLTLWPHTASYFRALARAFPAHSTPRVFGSGPGATETLPWEMKGGYLIPGKRALSILLQIPPFSEAYQEKSSWWEVYAAVSAVWAMCGRVGKAGYAEGIGKNGVLTVELREIIEKQR
ncbi:MAG: hypothetical protein Q9208_006699 [Pyrenodesmia sp. 3 TL-2023]